MANETTSSTLSNQIAAAYDTTARFALRSVPVFDQFATVKAGSLTNPGTPVTFHIWTDLAAQTTALNEVTDVTPVQLGSSTKDVTPAEQGMTTVTTAKLRADTMLPAFNSDQANIVAYNMAISVDTLARTALEGSSNEVTVDGGAENALTAGDVFTADFVRQQHAELVDGNVMPIGDSYVMVIHPHVAYDLKSETGDGAWVAPSQYVNTEKIWNNEIGKFAGFKFLESNRASITADGGASAVDTYRAYALGQEALAKAVSIPVGIVPGPITDYLKRLVPLGWYGYFGYDTFRDEAARILVSASSIGANT
jgi:N4-gp56 family major capsid protein